MCKNFDITLNKILSVIMERFIILLHSWNSKCKRRPNCFLSSVAFRFTKNSSHTIAPRTYCQSSLYGIEQWFLTFLMLGCFNTVPHIMVTSTIKLFCCYFITDFSAIMNCNNINICVFQWF